MPEGGADRAEKRCKISALAHTGRGYSSSGRSTCRSPIRRRCECSGVEDCGLLLFFS
jgi:hypothetical protein